MKRIDERKEVKGMFYYCKKCAIQVIEAGENYDAEVGSKKEEIRKENDAKEQERIDETNEKMRQEQFHMSCPVCGSKNVQKISIVGKYAKIGVFGILGADDFRKLPYIAL